MEKDSCKDTTFFQQYALSFSFSLTDLILINQQDT